jgi:hypothetical protein
MGKGSELFSQDTMNERKKVTKDNIRIVFFTLIPPYLSYCANVAITGGNGAQRKSRPYAWYCSVFHLSLEAL